MALKNTYLTKGAGYYINLTQEALVRGGAAGISYNYEDKKIVGITFSIDLMGNMLNFKLPINWRKFQEVLRKEGHVKAVDDDYAYRVAWANIKDWIEAQMAFIESENVTIAQVFLPYAVTKDGQTLFEKVASNPELLLGDGK